jgi:hypothetical protein
MTAAEEMVMAMASTTATVMATVTTTMTVRTMATMERTTTIEAATATAVAAESSLSKVSRLAASWELGVGQVRTQYGGPTAKLVVNQEIRAHWLAKRWEVFSLIVNIGIVESF